MGDESILLLYVYSYISVESYMLSERKAYNDI